MKKKYDLCIHVGTDDWLVDFYIKVWEFFNNKGISVLLLTFTPNHIQIFEARNFEHFLLVQKKEGMDLNGATLLAHKLGFPALQSLYRTEKYFFDIDETHYQDQVSKYFCFISEIKDHYDIKEFFTYEGDELEHNIFRAFAKLCSGNLSYFGYSNYNINLHFHNDEMRYYFIPEAHKSFEEAIDVESKEKIKKYIEGYTLRQPKLWGDPKKFDLNFKTKYLGIAAKKFFQQLTNNVGDKRFSFNAHFKAYFGRLIKRTGAFKYYEKQPLESFKGQSIYFFPMHVPNDSQLTQRGLPFYNQANLIEMISNYLPFPSKLLVKEHPNGRGFYSLEDLKKISELPNVILLSPEENSHEIIKMVKGIFVINSSVGFESLLYQKPVVTFGRSFYRGLGLTIDIESLYDIETVFNRIDEFEVPYEKVEQFIYKLMKLTYDIDMYNFNKDNYKDKVEVYADALYDYIFRTKKHTTNGTKLVGH
ncbi:capsular polysaccharide export protein, LipB/KpsS family [Pedobacter gandavensis]|uniref:Capsular biosynthesis protein n=1 Tax=Pedobacter gandavensis TaxID=2679963 RepID=A0ABR6EXA7_9SPHI|nr:hypothetical protein [Pedobacter gandavensis]MBB2149901.1 hypothetical protein [Pedobacter gandavensis]